MDLACHHPLNGSFDRDSAARLTEGCSDEDFKPAGLLLGLFKIYVP